MDEEHVRKTERVYKELYDGNGKKPMVREVTDLRRETNTMWQDLYHNPHTGDSGLVADMKQIKSAVVWVKGASAAVSAGAVLGAALAVRALLGG